MWQRISQLGSRNYYGYLPTHASTPPAPNWRIGYILRRALLICVLFSACIAIYPGFSELRRTTLDTSLDTSLETSLDTSSTQFSDYLPTYEQFYEMERQYPQHNASLPFPEGENGRFLWISEQHHSVGWNDAFETLVLMAQVAYLSKRSYVFEPYTWKRVPEHFVYYGDHLTPSRIPLAALIDGPIAGGSFPPESPNPRFVNLEFFKQVCPEERRVRINIEDLSKDLGWSSPAEKVKAYSSKLLGMSESCVEVYGEKYMFEWINFVDSRIETVFDMLSQSPLLREFRWSPLVLSAVRTNAPYVAPGLASNPLPELVPELMAIHVRRGDFLDHCQGLARSSFSYMGWSQTPGLPDPFTPPPGGDTPENMAEYIRHCFPDINQIVDRVEQVRHEWETRTDRRENSPRLRRLYIMTNGKKEWIEELKRHLLASGHWDVVFSSRDMKVSPEQKFVGQAIDAAIAERAAVFLGNGFSTLTANTILMRRIRNLPLDTIRFW